MYSRVAYAWRIGSLPTRGGWIEITQTEILESQNTSLPTRGGWIEIGKNYHARKRDAGPSPHGEGGLKWLGQQRREWWRSPSPHGEGGLKYFAARNMLL